MRIIFLNICLFFSISLWSQYESASQFNLAEKLDKEIVLDEKFDYDLVNMGVMHYTNLHRTKKKKSNFGKVYKRT